MSEFPGGFLRLDRVGSAGRGGAPTGPEAPSGEPGWVPVPGGGRSGRRKDTLHAEESAGGGRAEADRRRGGGSPQALGG